jgi:hypothetical protein
MDLVQKVVGSSSNLFRRLPTGGSFFKKVPAGIFFIDLLGGETFIFSIVPIL